MATAEDRQRGWRPGNSSLAHHRSGERRWQPIAGAIGGREGGYAKAFRQKKKRGREGGYAKDVLTKTSNTRSIIYSFLAKLNFLVWKRGNTREEMRGKSNKISEDMHKTSCQFNQS
jgi:hypothetical protein